MSDRTTGQPPASPHDQHLETAHHLLRLQEEMSALRDQVARLENAVADHARIIASAKRLVALLKELGPLLSTPKGQGLLGFVMAMAAAAIKWLTGSG